eukprot:1159238-Pelagomonas_calceolata.AAC.1
MHEGGNQQSAKAYAGHKPACIKKRISSQQRPTLDTNQHAIRKESAFGTNSESCITPKMLSSPSATNCCILVVAKGSPAVPLTKVHPHCLRLRAHLQCSY